MDFLNIIDRKVVKYIKEYLIAYKVCENSYKLQKIISLFPFAKLLECDGVDEVLIMNLTDVLSVFATSPKFYRKISVECTVDFILLQINFLTKSANSDRVLFKLMKLLYEICTRLHETNGISEFLNVQRICELLIPLFASKRHNEIKSYGKKILIAFLSTSNIEMNEMLKNCIEEVYKNVDPLQNKGELFKLLITTLKKCKKMYDFDATFKWLEVSYQCLLYNQEPNFEILNCVIDCIMLSLEQRDGLEDFNKRLINELKKNLHEICLTIIRINGSEFVGKLVIINKMKYLLFAILNDECEKLQMVWYGGLEKLRCEINELIKTDDWPQTLSDVFFFIAYIECLNNRMQWNQGTVLEAIRRKVAIDESITSLTLRSIAFLYSALVEDTVKFDRTKLYILKELMVCRHLITPHPLQIQWILKEGPLKLKFHALRICFENNPNDYQDILNDFVDYKSLVNYVLSANDHLSHKTWIIKLLRAQNSYNISKYILRSIATNFSIEPEIKALLFQTEPMAPLNANMCFVILQHLKDIMYQIQNATSLKCVLNFVTNILTIYKLDSKYYITFCEVSQSIKFLIYLTSCHKEEELALSAIKLLKVLVRLQGRHKISVMETCTINFLPSLCGNEPKIIEALRLLFIVLRRRARIPILKLDETTILELFHKLQDLSFNLAAPTIFRCLTYLLYNWEYLIRSCVTIVLIDKYFISGQKACMPGFLQFLKIWLRKIYRYDIPLCGITTEELAIYLNAVNTEFPVKDIMDLINKIAVGEEALS